jgi:hypothetical protein
MSFLEQKTKVRSGHINLKDIGTDSNPWMTRLQINLIALYLPQTKMVRTSLFTTPTQSKR